MELFLSVDLVLLAWTVVLDAFLVPQIDGV